MIPFPKLHIAESVLNRIHNALNDEPAGFGLEMPTPLAPEPIAEGVKVDEGTDLPAEPMQVAPEEIPSAQQGMLDASMSGGSPLDGALIGASV